MRSPNVLFLDVLFAVSLLLVHPGVSAHGATFDGTSEATDSTPRVGPDPAPSYRVEGTISGVGGAPLAGARITAHRPITSYSKLRALLEERPLPSPVAWSEADAAGRYRLELPAGLYRLSVTAPGHVGLYLHGVAVTGPVVLPPAVLGRAVEARVEVLDVSGAPLAGAAVVLFPSSTANNSELWAPHRRDGWRPPARYGRTDAEGTLLSSRLDGEWLDVHVWPPGRSDPFSVREVEGTRLLLETPPPRNVRLAIRDADGRPAPEVVVAVGRPPWPAGVSDAAGAVEISIAGNRAVPLLLLTPDGRFRWTSLPPVPRLELRLAAPVRLAGRVVGDGGPVAGALVWTNVDPGAFTFTGSDGRFELPAAAEGGWVRAQSAGYPGLQRSWDQAPPEGPLELRLERRPRRTAHGRVLDLEDRPLAGATVAVRPASSAPWLDPAGTGPRWRTETDGTGRFVFPTLPADRLDLWAVAPGHAPFLVRGVRVVEPPDAAPEQGEERRRAELGTLILEPAATVRGRVVDDRGEAVAGASVWAFEAERSPGFLHPRELRRRPADATSDAAGHFEVAGRVPGARIDLVAHAPGHAPAARRGVVPPLDEALTFELPVAAGVGGRVEDPDGRPIADASVELWPEEPPQGRVAARRLDDGDARRATSDPEGRFRLDDVRPGRYRLRAEAEGWAPAEPIELTVAVPADDLEPVLVLRPGAVLTGRVTDVDGEPVDGARLGLAAAGTRSDAGGRYRLTGLPTGPQTLEVRHEVHGRWARELEIEEGEQSFDVRLSPTRVVAGRVVTGDGEPVAGAVVSLEAQGWRDVRTLRAKSGGGGRFEFPEVTDGEYSLAVEKAGFAPPEPATALSVAGEGREDLLLRLDPAAAIEGRLLGLDAEELLTARVEARWGERRRSGTVTYDGDYRIPDLAPGEWTVVATARRGERQARELVWIPRGERSVSRDVRFESGLRLEGLVLDGGEPLPDAAVWLRGRDVAAERPARTDHAGRFTVDDLEPGSYLLGVSERTRAITHHQELDLRTDRQVVVEIATARVRGRVGSGGEPVADALVSLRALLGAEAASVTTVGTGPDGTFDVERLAAGSYRVTVRKSGYATVEDRIEVPAGVEISNLEYELAPAHGLELQVSTAAGAVPPWAAVTVLGAAGEVRLVEQQQLDPSGKALFATVPPGEQELLVWAPDLAPRRLRARLPGEPRAVVLAEAGTVSLRIGTLARPSSVAWARLVDASSGRLFEGVDPHGGAPATRWRVEAGRARIPGVPAGPWRLEVRSLEGARWSTDLAVPPRGETLVELD